MLDYTSNWRINQMNDQLAHIILIDFNGYEHSHKISITQLLKTIDGYYFTYNNRLYLCNTDYLVFHEIDK